MLANLPTGPTTRRTSNTKDTEEHCTRITPCDVGSYDDAPCNCARLDDVGSTDGRCEVVKFNGAKRDYNQTAIFEPDCN